MQEIVERLKIRDNLNEVTVQDIRALRAHGVSLDSITKAIAEAKVVSEYRLGELLDDVVERNKAYYGELATLADITAPEMIVSAADIEAIYKQTRDELRNITRSMGFLVDAGRTMLPPAKAYQWALDNATMQIQSGAISYTQAISNATRELANSGLKTVDYESGHVDHVDVAVRRAVLSGVNALCSRYSEQSMEFLETDLVEVSAHAGARDVDGPNGWENHRKWQGKIYRWKKL